MNQEKNESNIDLSKFTWKQVWVLQLNILLSILRCRHYS